MAGDKEDGDKASVPTPFQSLQYVCGLHWGFATRNKTKQDASTPPTKKTSSLILHIRKTGLRK
jgi:hypothetical protein